MIITLSPAKMLDFKIPAKTENTTIPVFEKQAGELIEELAKYNVEDLAGLEKINLTQALTVYQQIHAFSIDKTPKKSSGFAYNGIAYKGLDFKSFDEEDLLYAQEHLVILSGLYGALRPLDAIKPYRLEMQAELQNKKGYTLYDFWGDNLTEYLSKRLNCDDKIWLNLMSNEYTKAIDKKKLPKNTTIIVPAFKEQTATGYRQVVVHTKKARGMMARFALKNRITDIEHLKAFDEEGYTYSPELSKGNEWMFVR
ncbi:peroxide stress protein YaaA [Dysgonomonas sp. 216]|uniref:YaaA family protein n=1 Tax=Dysgonomonas sp. 216 TaxID=2302934 RepID=UPI0013D6C261|nr:YaaA family protein [Dysgonomonas sp. 216]NDW18417.1 peroxide stress protein YaaA [Dysgonomonas sp. 216]